MSGQNDKGEMMGQDSKIEWTHHTFNPWRGCSKVSPGCEHCYAATFSQRNPAQLGVWGANGTRVLASDAMWREPLKWNAAAEAAGERHRVFCASLADVFEDWGGVVSDSRELLGHVFDAGEIGFGPRMVGMPFGTTSNTRPLKLDDVRRRLFSLIDQTPHLDWLLLTKRPENIRRMIPCDGDTNGDGDCEICARGGSSCKYHPNVWLGTSVENQEQADKRIPELLKCRALSPVLFLSCEPLLGPVDLIAPLQSELTKAIYKQQICPPPQPATKACVLSAMNCMIDWVIAGGESGTDARPMHPDWARSLRAQCHAGGVPFFFKQWGERLPHEYRDGEIIPPIDAAKMGRLLFAESADAAPRDPGGLPIHEVFSNGSVVWSNVGKKAAGRVLDGRTWDEFPVGSAVAT